MRLKIVSYRGSIFGALIVLALLLSGCTKDASELIESAHRRYVSGDHVGAILDLKAAIQQEPANGNARFMLGRLYNETFDAGSAEAELKRARDLGIVEGGRVSIELARAYRAQGKHKELLTTIQTAAAFEQVSNATIHAYRGRAHLALRNVEEARKSLAAASELDDKVAEVVLLGAILVASEQKFDEALARINSLLAQHPRFFEGWRLKAQLLAVQGRDDETLATYDKLLELHPSYFGALVGRSNIFMRLGRMADAEKDVASLLKAHGRHPLAHVQNSLVLLATGRAAKALDAIQVALKSEPIEPAALLVSGLVHREIGSMQQAESLLSAYVKSSPDDMFGRYSLASVLVRSKSADRALEVLAPLMAGGQTHQSVLLLVADAYSSAGDSAKALEWYERAIAVDPSVPDPHVRQAFLRFRMGEMDKATLDLDTGLKLAKGVSVADEVLVLSQIRKGDLDAAMKAAARMLEKAPEQPMSHNMIGAVWLARKDAAKAEAAFQEALRLRPGFFPSARNLSAMALGKGEPSKARGYLEEVVGRDPKNVMALIELARIGQQIDAAPDEIETWLKAAMAADPRATEPVGMLARHYLKMGDPKRALEVTDSALSRSPDDTRLMTMAAQAQMLTGESNRALATFRRVVSKEPKSAVALLRLAEVQLAVNSPTDAVATLRRAIVLDPNLPAAYLMLAESEVRAGRAEEALSIASMLKKANPKRSLGWVLEGDIHARAKRYEQAIGAYEQAVKVEKSIDAVGKLYGALVLAGKSEDAFRRLDTLAADASADRGIAMYAAQLYREQGKYDRAIRHYERVVEMYPNDVAALNNLALSYSEVGDKRAAAIAERAYVIAPGNPAVLSTMGWVLVKEGRQGKGIDLMKKALQIQPRSSLIRFAYARALVTSGETQEARKTLEKLIEDSPNSSEGPAARKLLADLRS